MEKVIGLPSLSCREILIVEALEIVELIHFINWKNEAQEVEVTFHKSPAHGP